jgi:NAD(P)H-dependent FMN reductase
MTVESNRPQDATADGANPLRVALVIGSTREGRFGPVVANWFMRQIEQRGDMTVDVLDLAGFDLPARMPAAPDGSISAFVDRIGSADAFVIVTPEYNHGYPASLKLAIDYGHAEWQAKPVGFVSYGGIAGGLRAVEQLRQVFAELHAVTVRDTVSFADVWTAFDRDGEPRDADAALGAVKVMLDALSWWGDVLRDARATRPYVA